MYYITCHVTLVICIISCKWNIPVRYFRLGLKPVGPVPHRVPQSELVLENARTCSSNRLKSFIPFEQNGSRATVSAFVFKEKGYVPPGPHTVIMSC